MKNKHNWNPYGGAPTANAPDAVLIDWCRRIVRRAHGDEALALALYQATAYASHREGEQLETRAILIKPDRTFMWMHGGGLDQGFHTAFAQMIALHATAWDAHAAAIVGEMWVPARPLAPGERPSQQDDREEAVYICAQARMNLHPVSLNLMIPLVDGRIAAAPKTMPGGQAMFMGFGRFISSPAPSPEKREAAQALIRTLTSRTVENRMEASAEDLAKIAAYNPTAKPPNWNEISLSNTGISHEEETTAFKPIDANRYYLGLWYWPYPNASTGDFLLCASRRLSEPLDWELEFRFRRPMNCTCYSTRLSGKTEQEAEAIASDLLKRMEVGTKDQFKLAEAPFEFWPARCSGTALLEKMAHDPPPRFFIINRLPNGHFEAVTPLIR